MTSGNKGFAQQRYSSWGGVQSVMIKNSYSKGTDYHPHVEILLIYQEL